jgi:hypothetical protein
MGILSVNGSATPMFSNPATQDESGSSFTQRYQVLFNNIDTASGASLQLAEALALNAPGVPQIGNIFRLNRKAYCTSKSAQTRVQNNKPLSVIVTCVFSTRGREDKDETDDPLAKRPVITWSPIFEREAVKNARIIKVFQGGQEIKALRQQDQGGAANINNFKYAIANSFGAEFDQFPEKEVPYMQWTVTQNLPFFDVGQAIKLLQTVNIKPFRIDGEKILAGQNLLIQHSATVRYAGDLSYREVTTSGLIKTTHDVQVLDNGDQEFWFASDKFQGGKEEDGIKITNKGGDEIIAKLDGKGNALEKGQDPVFLHFGVYGAADHNSLNIPSGRL